MTTPEADSGTEPDPEAADLTVLAIGGHSLIDPDLPPTVQSQFEVTARAMAPIAELIASGQRLVLTHGNGPQVGFMQLRSDLARDQIHPVPLDSIVADTQGSLGYMIERVLRDALRRLGCDPEVVTLVTEVVVDPNDKSFTEQTKPIGRYYSREAIEPLAAENGWTVKEGPRGWRRVVASPHPVTIIQERTIARLVADGVVVIACGGGGIPVVRGEDGSDRGVEAVIDKDRVSALLALRLGAPRLVITTGSDVCVDFGTPQQRRLERTNVAELQSLLDAGQFPAGSMGPKIEAAIRFLYRGGREALICEPHQLVEALAGTAGTRITP